jgi:hypothetical protein
MEFLLKSNTEMKETQFFIAVFGYYSIFSIKIQYNLYKYIIWFT